MVNIASQVLDLVVNKGITAEEVAAVLGLNIDDVNLIIQTNNKVEDAKDFDKLLAEYKPKALKILFNIASDVSEKTHLRATCATAICNMGKTIGEGDDNLLKQRLEEMRKKVSEVMKNTKIININTENSTSTCSNMELVKN